MDPFDIAERLLSVLVAAFADAQESFTREYVSDGSVAFDFDEALVVEWDRTEPNPGAAVTGVAIDDMSSGTMALQSVFTIHAMRFSPWPDETGTPPTPEQIHENAMIVHRDARRILDTLLASLGDSELFGVCGSVRLVNQTAVGPDGGIVGSATQIAVTA